jgi:hypothetical protein
MLSKFKCYILNIYEQSKVRVTYIFSFIILINILLKLSLFVKLYIYFSDIQNKQN